MYKSFIALATAASSALASTPPGIQPATQQTLMVWYGDWAAENGNEIPKSASQDAPMIGTQSQLEGTSYAVMMVDLDIPTGRPPATDTLLHWMQTGLTQTTRPMPMTGSAGGPMGWVLAAPGSTPANTPPGQSAADTASGDPSDGTVVAYAGPWPPAQRPLTHRYVQMLIDTSDATEQQMQALQGAAMGRFGFSCEEALAAAGMADRLVAANWFTTTNPAGGSAGWGSGNGTAGAGPTATGGLSGPTQAPGGGGEDGEEGSGGEGGEGGAGAGGSSDVPVAAGPRLAAGGVAAGMVGVGALFLML